MKLQQLRYVVKVAECGSITEASRRLFVSQPSITASIRDLENEMGVHIFERTNKGVVVSEEGETFLGYARQVLDQADLLEGKYKGASEQVPHFSVSCQHYSFAVNAFVDVIREFDAARYDFTLREEQTHEIIEDVAHMKSELGILYLSEHNREVIERMLAANELVFEGLFCATPHVFVCADHPLAGRSSVTLEDLEDYPFLSYEQGLENEMGVHIFERTNKGVVVSEEGETFLGYARQVLDQADLLEGKYKGASEQVPHFSVSCQHYSFAVNAFVDVIREFDAARYDFTLREEQTHEIIEDVAHMKSELGILYLSEHNREVIERMLAANELVFEGLFCATPHVFVCADHPLAGRSSVTLEDLEDYPFLSYEQGSYNSFYYSEELTSTFERRKNIRVRDRATLFNLVMGLNGYTVCSGVISHELNGPGIISIPLDVDEYMEIGIITRKNTTLTRYGRAYIDAIRQHI